MESISLDFNQELHYFCVQQALDPFEGRLVLEYVQKTGLSVFCSFLRKLTESTLHIRNSDGIITTTSAKRIERLPNIETVVVPG